MNAPGPERMAITEKPSGLIERVTFHNDESGGCGLRVKAKGQREETTVVGSLPSVNPWQWLVAEGWWVRDKEHGLPFKARLMKTVPPTTVEGIKRYLGSGPSACMPRYAQSGQSKGRENMLVFHKAWEV